MKSLVFLILLSIMVGVVGASTVTLTGTCYSGIITEPNNYIVFNLTNSGNGTATNLVITPMINVATPNNTTVTIPFVGPGVTYSEKIYLWNFTSAGSFVEQFAVRYSQGTNQFTTIFPCLADFLVGAQSLVGITNLGRTSSGVFVNFTNTAPYTVNTQATIYAPPSFLVSPLSSNSSVQPHGNVTEGFEVTPPQITDAEFPIAVGVSYVVNGVHYSTLAVTSITFAGIPASSKLPQLGGTLLIISLLLAIIIIIILIVLSIIYSRKKKEKEKLSNQNTNI